MDDGVFRSSNRGVDWTAWNFGLFDLHILSIVISANFAEDQRVFLGTESGIFGSMNSGLGWREVDFPLESAPVLSLALKGEQILAGTEEAGLFLSTVGDHSWQQVADARAVGSVNAIITDSQSNDMLIMNDEKVLVSRDQGETWQNKVSNQDFAAHPLAVVAPPGMGENPQIIVGLANGEILHI
jgi:photosystem II stability/assembly factor-like uncharacterized protein